MPSPIAQTPHSIPTKRLAQSITASDTTFQLSDILGWDGVALAAASFGDTGYGAIRDANNTILELFTFDPDTIASSSITFLKRGLKFNGDLTTEVAANKLNWPKGSMVELGSNTPQLFQWLKEYIDAAAVAGGVPASTVAAGIVKAGTQAQVDAGTGDDGVYKYVPTPATMRAKAYHDYAADAGATDSYAITVTPAISAYATGQIFTFKANTSNTGPATLAVNGLAAKTIKKNVDGDLTTGDIIANQIVTVEYDGTNFQLLSRAPSIPIVRSYLTAVSPATWTKPAGLKYVVVEVQAAGGNGGGANVGGSQSAGGGGGGGGGYGRKLIAASALGATETVTIGAVGAASSFGAHVTANQGANGADEGAGGAGGTASGGDVNSPGGGGGGGTTESSERSRQGGMGGGSILGSGGGGGDGKNGASSGGAGSAYGGGGGGAAADNSTSASGGAGGAAIVIVTEHY